MQHNPHDLEIELAVIRSQIQTGVPLQFVIANSSEPHLAQILGTSTAKRKRGKMPRWSKEEEDFLKEHLGKIPESAIAAALGRTVIAVHLRWKRDLGLHGPSYDPNVITCNQIAEGLRKDGKTIGKLIDRGILPGRRLPFDSGAVIRVVDRVTFLRWVINPMHWIYFNPARVGTRSPRRRGIHKFEAKFWKYVHRLLELKRARWKDEWWSIGRVARYHRVDHTLVNTTIHRGRLRALDWGNWWILKSDALAIKFYTGKGRPGCEKLNWSPAGDAFLIRAHAAGFSFRVIAKMMKQPQKRVIYRLNVLKSRGRIPQIIRSLKNKRYSIKGIGHADRKKRP